MPKIKRISAARRFNQLLRYSARRKKSRYNPKTGTNWCHMPMEIRSMCIDAMDFQTRISLRRTAKAEKSLVDSKPYHFDRVTCTFSKKRMCGSAENKNGENKEEIAFFSKSRSKNYQCALQLLNKCHVDNLNFCCFSSLPDQVENTALSVISRCVPFRFRRIAIDSEDSAVIHLLLNNSPNVERIAFTTVLGVPLIQTIVEVPAVINVKALRSVSWGEHSSLWHLISKWIEIDADVGKSVQFATTRRETVASFASVFAERVIEKTEMEVRIRMNDESKQILFMSIGSNRGIKDFITCKVIPIDMPKEEYGRGDEWINSFYKAEMSGKYFQGVESDGEINEWESESSSSDSDD